MRPEPVADDIAWTPPVNVNEKVKVRTRNYLVTDVIPPVNRGDATLVRLACLDDDAAGDSLEVLWEREIDAFRTQGHLLARIDHFDQAQVFAAYYHVLLWNRVTATDASLFQSPYRAGIQVKDYQLEPLRKALLLPRVNLFIADDVGLGKTIEAGLILRELIIRQRVKRVVVACPPSVVRQWSEELENRFGLSFVIFDRDYQRRCRRQQGYAINPWTTHHHFIVSHALLRDEAYAGPLREWLKQERKGNLLILDEAHHAAPASANKYAVDSKFTRRMRELTPHFEHKLFLSATPHNGHSNSFSSLLEMLDPQRFCRGLPVDGKRQDEVMVRRLKGDLRALGVDFPKRNVVRISIENLAEDTAELQLSRLLFQYRQAREARYAKATKAQRASGMLVLIALQKRLLSSIEAFACTLKIHQQSLDKESQRLIAARHLAQLSQGVGSDDEAAELSEEQLAEDEAQKIRQSTARLQGIPPVSQEERQLVAQMSQIAQEHRHLPDPKVSHLISWIKSHMCSQLGEAEASWNDRRIVIFTEYADSKRYLQQQLEALALPTQAGPLRVKTFHGGMGEEQREILKKAFNTDPQEEPLRILIATDAAREGVNLQNHCADLFHYDNPWNPSRMEQRNGRIDRKLQRADEVFCYYFSFKQRSEDRVLETLINKSKTILAELGSMSPVLAYQMERLLEEGIDHRHESSLCQAIENEDADSATYQATVVTELERCRQNQGLADQIKALQDDNYRAQTWLQLESGQLRKTVDTALRLLGSAGLEAGSAGDQVPDLSALLGRGWSRTLDSLRPAREKDESLSSWRRRTVLRPVVFSDSGSMDQKVVHLHLQHLLVQRLFAFFISQGFGQHQLARACVLPGKDPRPMVLLLGRLSVYGPGASRLHDEIFAVGARWSQAGVAGPHELNPFQGEEARELQDNLARNLARNDLDKVPDQARQLLLASANHDREQLQPHLLGKGQELLRRAKAQLGKRGRAEAQAMKKILEDQRKRILASQAALQKEEAQISLAFMAELEQRKSEAQYWQRRLGQIDQEIISEPEAVQATYQVTTHRLESVGLVYFWPDSA